MKLFVVHPGHVMSREDLQHHYIGASQLMHLYGVNQNECIIDDPDRPERMLGYSQDFLDKLMHLAPMTGVDYRPVSKQERENIRERLAA